MVTARFAPKPYRNFGYLIVPDCRKQLVLDCIIEGTKSVSDCVVEEAKSVSDCVVEEAKSVLEFIVEKMGKCIRIYC